MEFSDPYDSAKADKTSELDYTALYNNTQAVKLIPPHTPVTQSKLARVQIVSPVSMKLNQKSPISVRRPLVKSVASPNRTMNFTATMAFNNSNSQMHLRYILSEALKQQVNFKGPQDDVIDFQDIQYVTPNLSHIDLVNNKLQSYNTELDIQMEQFQKLTARAETLLNETETIRLQEGRRSSYFCTDFNEQIQVSDVRYLLPKQVEKVFGITPMVDKDCFYLPCLGSLVVFKIC